MNTVTQSLIVALITIIPVIGTLVVTYLKKLIKKIEDNEKAIVETHATVTHNCKLQEERHVAQNNELRELVDALVVKEVKTRVKIAKGENE